MRQQIFIWIIWNYWVVYQDGQIVNHAGCRYTYRHLPSGVPSLNPKGWLIVPPCEGTIWHPNWKVQVDMGVSKNSGTPKSSHFDRVFHYKPSISGYPYFWKHPYTKWLAIDYSTPPERKTAKLNPWKIKGREIKFCFGGVSGPNFRGSELLTFREYEIYWSTLPETNITPGKRGFPERTVVSQPPFF